LGLLFHNCKGEVLLKKVAIFVVCLHANHPSTISQASKCCGDSNLLGGHLPFSRI
jgi:hypothetical protein